MGLPAANTIIPMIIKMMDNAANGSIKSPGCVMAICAVFAARPASPAEAATTKSAAALIYFFTHKQKVAKIAKCEIED